MTTPLHLAVFALLVAGAAPIPLAAQPPLLASEHDACVHELHTLEVALAAEGPRRVVFAEHLEMVRESQRRGEAVLCLDLAALLRDKLSQFEA